MLTNAYDVKIDGIYYNFTEDEAEVTYQRYRDSYGYYESDYVLNVVIPNSINYNGKTYRVTSIGYYAFDHCSGLKSVTIPESVTKIGGAAFRGCSGLTTIIIPESVTIIGYMPFEGCSSLHYNEYDNARYLGNDANPYYALITGKSTNITSCEINTMCKLVGGGAFASCTSLTSITIPENVVNIGGYAFRFCSSLTSMSIGNSVTSIGEYAFENCSSLTSIVIPNSVTYIGFHSFSFCSGLTSITIPCSVLDIDYHAFSWCENLVSIIIPNSVTTIGARAFYRCSKLASVTIGSSIGSIREFAFQACPSLTDVYCYTETVPNTEINAFEDTNITPATLHVPAALVEAYSTTEPWSGFGSILSLTYSLTYIVDGEVYKSYDIEYGAAITPEPEPTKEGYTFSGWSEIPETMPAYNVTVTGSFTKDILGTCSTPTISYANGELTFNSETEGVTFHYDIDIEDNEIRSGNSDKVQLSVTYHISVYATKEDYYDSEVATGTLCWIDVKPSTEGIIIKDDATEVNEVKALPVLIQSNGGTITVQGANEGTPIAIYDIDGKQYGSAISEKECTTIATSLRPGTIAIVKIGKKSIKVLVK